MRKAELTALLERLEVRPSRKLGQNFLVDENCLAALVRASAPQAGERILEIGPGTGVLTERLLESGCIVTAVEYDHRLAGYLREKYAGNGAFTLVEGDACKVDFNELFPLVNGPFRCIANLPYSCGSVILARMLELPNPPQELYILLQREMAERICAQPNTPDYGVLTVRLALRYRAEIVRIVPPGVFFPPPEVASAYVRLTLKPGEVLPDKVLKCASLLAGAAFAQRRKKALRLLMAASPGFDFEKAMAGMGIPVDARAEIITPAQYVALARSIEEEN